MSQGSRTDRSAGRVLSSRAGSRKPPSDAHEQPRPSRRRATGRSRRLRRYRRAARSSEASTRCRRTARSRTTRPSWCSRASRWRPSAPTNGPPRPHGQLQPRAGVGELGRFAPRARVLTMYGQMTAGPRYIGSRGSSRGHGCFAEMATAFRRHPRRDGYADGGLGAWAGRNRWRSRSTATSRCLWRSTRNTSRSGSIALSRSLDRRSTRRCRWWPRPRADRRRCRLAFSATRRPVPQLHARGSSRRSSPTRPAPMIRSTVRPKPSR